MDTKSWLWKRKSSEKTVAVSDGVPGEESLGDDRVAKLERTVENLNEKLSYTLSECKSKDDLATKHAKMADEALAGWKKTKEEAASLKQNLDKALHQKVDAEERITHLDAALKECMQQLRFVRDEQEQMINNAVTKTSIEHEKIQIALEGKLAETNKRLSKLGLENNHLSKTIQVKENLIEDLKLQSSQTEADFDKLRAGLDSMQKENASMNYELRMLEKELEIRNEEREFNRRSTEASHKQHVDSVKKIAKLENECQRLRLLVQKRLPGPAALARMKSEVDMLGKDQAGTTRNKLIPPMGATVVKDFSQELSQNPSKKVNYLMDRLCDIEEENKTLKEALSKKINELQSSRTMYKHTASKLLQVEAQMAESPKSQTTMELPRKFMAQRRLSFASESEINASDAESWTPSLMAETENFHSEKAKGSPSCRTVGSSDICLMDDFVEMEKLAIVCVDKSSGDSYLSANGSPALLGSLKTKSSMSSPEAAGKELIPINGSHSNYTDRDQGVRPKHTISEKHPAWLQDILKIVLEQNRVSLRNPGEIVEDIRVALVDIGRTSSGDIVETESLSLSSPSKLPNISGYISWRPQNSSPVEGSLDSESATKIYSNEVNAKHLQSGLRESICKIIELIERINQQSSKDISNEQSLSENDGSSLPYNNSLTPTGYTNCVFQWKSTELNHVLRQFVHTCNDLLNGSAEFENFAGQLASTFDWIMNHCFSLQNVSSMRDAIKIHFDRDEPPSESKCGIGLKISYSETASPQASPAALNAKKFVSQWQKTQSSLSEEDRKLKDERMEVDPAKNDLEVRLQSANDKMEALTTELQKSEKSTVILQAELEALKASKAALEDQIEHHKLINEDLITQLSAVRVELNEVSQKSSSLEVELEVTKTSRNELETTCLEQQLQLQSVTKNKLNYDPNRHERQLQNGWEITAASEKLAECQETILNLGKQLKALASSKETTVLSDKAIQITPSTPTANNNRDNSNSNNRSSLLQRILAENGNEPDGMESPKMKEIICTTDSESAPAHLPDNVKSAKPFTRSNEKGYKSDNSSVGALAIVPSQKSGRGMSLLKKLLSRRKKDTGRRMTFPINA